VEEGNFAEWIGALIGLKRHFLLHLHASQFILLFDHATYAFAKGRVFLHCFFSQFF
jgi:hypothetical protein